MAISKYVVTVDSETGKPIKLQRMGESGELTDEDLGLLFPARESGGPGVSIAVNIYAAGYPGGTSVYTGTTPGQTGGVGGPPAGDVKLAAHVGQGPPH